MIIIAPSALLLVEVELMVPMIVITNSANQNTVSIIFKVILTFVFAHRLSRLTWAVATWYAMKTADFTHYSPRLLAMNLSGNKAWKANHCNSPCVCSPSWSPAVGYAGNG